MMSGNGSTASDGGRAADVVAQAQMMLRQSDLAGATQLALDALASGMAHPLLLHLRSNYLESQGRIDEALADLRQGILLMPDDAVAHFAYGQLLARAGDFEQAAHAFSAAVQLQPGYASAFFELGQVLGPLGEPERRRKAYEAVIALKPDHADALAQLAQASAELGEWPSATELAERALKVEPGNHVAMIALAQTAIGENRLGDAEMLIRRVDKMKDLPVEDRAVVHAITGDLRHAQKRYPEAFDAYAEANTIKRNLYAPRFAAPGGETALTYAQWLTEYRDVAAPPLWRAGGDTPMPVDGEARSHIFMVGFPRSGTTLLENILASHTDVEALQEKKLFDDAVRDLLSNDDGRKRLLHADDTEMAKYRAVYWQNVRNHGVDAAGKVFIDNSPFNVTRLLLIAKLFPAAKIVFVTRDPRDVVFSCFRSPFSLNPAMYEFLTLKSAAAYYDAVMSLAQMYREDLNLDWIDWKHEALLDDFDGRTRELCEAIGIAWTGELRNFAEHAAKRSIGTLSAAQVRRGLNREGIGQWRHYRSKLKPALPVLEPWVERFGYEPS